LDSSEVVQVIKGSRPAVKIDPGTETEEAQELEAMTGLKAEISHLEVAPHTKDIVAFTPNSSTGRKSNQSITVYGLSSREHLNGVDPDVTAIIERQRGRNQQRPAE
jgi:hypothetical protein